MSKKTKAAEAKKAEPAETKKTQAAEKRTKRSRKAPTQVPEKSPEVEALRDEIQGLKKLLGEKITRLRELGGRVGGESDVVKKVVELLQAEKGATKLELVEATGAKKGYVDALLTRILPSKGYTIEGEARRGERGKVYRIP